MSGYTLSDNGPGRLADLVAELLKRFRHFSGEAEVAPGLASNLARIKISARLLTGAGLPVDSSRDDFVRLAGVLTELVERYESVPESMPHHLGPPVERLADYLEEVLIRLDNGSTLADVSADEGWATIQASFSNAGTPLAVLEDADDLLRRWGNRWSVDDLTPIQEKNLRWRWRELKKKGDLLFGSTESPDPEQPAPGSDHAGGQVLALLLDSSFRRDQLREMLTGFGYRVLVPADLRQAGEILDSDPSVQAVLCDNLEPTRHLVRLLGESPFRSREQDPHFVLVVNTSLGADRDEEQALALGAAAAWTDPFDLADLRRILQRLSHP